MNSIRPAALKIAFRSSSSIGRPPPRLKTSYSPSPFFPSKSRKENHQNLDNNLSQLQSSDIGMAGGKKISDTFVKYSSVDDLDPLKIDTRIPVMEKMWTKNLLSEYCKTHGMKSYGKKSELIARIRDYWGLPTSGNFCQKEVKLRPAELFIVKGKDNSTLEMLENAANVRISVDENIGILVIRGELQGVLKAKKSIEDMVKNVKTVGIPASKISLDVGVDTAILAIRNLANTFAVHEKTINQILMAAGTEEDLQAARSIIDSLNGINRKHTLLFQVPPRDIGPSISFYQCKDITWPSYFRFRPVFRPRRLIEQKERDPENPEILDLHMKTFIPSDSDCKTRLTFGNCVFYDDIIPISSSFNITSMTKDRNMTFTEFLDNLNNEKPLYSFIPTEVTFALLSKYRIPTTSLPTKSTIYEFKSKTDDKLSIELQMTTDDNCQLNLIESDISRKSIITNLTGILDLKYSVSSTIKRLSISKNEADDMLNKKIASFSLKPDMKFVLETINLKHALSLENDLEFVRYERKEVESGNSTSYSCLEYCGNMTLEKWEDLIKTTKRITF